jgi:hypothetical protein
MLTRTTYSQLYNFQLITPKNAPRDSYRCRFRRIVSRFYASASWLASNAT